LSQLEATFEKKVSSRQSTSVAKAWREGDRRLETANGNEFGVGKESCERPKAKSEQPVTCLVDDAEMRHASKRKVEVNQSSVTDERSRCWGKAAAPNVVIFLSSSSSSPSSIVKFDVKEIYKKYNISSELRTETGCSCRVLNVGKASAATQMQQ
jgi:hypothetical protein